VTTFAFPGRAMKTAYAVPHLRRITLLAWVVLWFAPVLLASSFHAVTISLRGVPESLAVYDPPAGTPRRPVQVIVTSGDLGWFGLSVDVAEYLQHQGYRVLGFSSRMYLSSFTGRKGRHLDAGQIPGDYRALMDWAAAGSAFPKEFVLVGVSEGAGLSVMAVGQSGGPLPCRGTVTLGIPFHTALAWRWTDFPMWITKKEPNEPRVNTAGYLAHLSVPIAMIQSTRDEYNPIARARSLFAAAASPREFILVDAANHRFSNKRPEVMSDVSSSLEWIESLHPKESP